MKRTPKRTRKLEKKATRKQRTAGHALGQLNALAERIQADPRLSEQERIALLSQVTADLELVRVRQ